MTSPTLHEVIVDLTGEIEALKTEIDRLQSVRDELQRRAGNPLEGLPYAGMTLMDAAKKCLRSGGALATADLRDELLAGGIETKSKNFYNILYTSLKEKGERNGIVKLGKKWAISPDGIEAGFDLGDFEEEGP